jgi:putative SOS response-associated peptidase YedK
MEKDRDRQAALRDRAQGRRSYGHGRLVGNLALEGWRADPRSFSIATTPPNELCAELHDRMPVVLKPDLWPMWLGEETADPAHLKALLVPYLSEDMIAWPESTRVGSVKNNDPSLIEPIALP